MQKSLNEHLKEPVLSPHYSHPTRSNGLFRTAGRPKGKTADPFALPSVFFPPRYHLFEQNKKSYLFTFCHAF
ncbi:hypothetical protein HMPREF1146_2336 [Prevotella sp. MSX73]|nr:hypothetical protein HMPREF1146_2336 [Prevotella sp. MSX73]